MGAAGCGAVLFLSGKGMGLGSLTGRPNQRGPERLAMGAGAAARSIGRYNWQPGHQ